MKIRPCLNLDEAMMGAVVKYTIGLWLNMTGECSSAPLAGLHPALFQQNTLSAGNGTMLTWIRKFDAIVPWSWYLLFKMTYDTDGIDADS